MDRGQSWSDRRVGGGTTILGGCPPGSYSRIYGWHKSETFSAELGWPLLWDIPIYVWHSHISSLGIPVSHRALVQRLTTKGVSLDGNFQLCSGSYSKSRTFSFAETKRLAYPVSKYWNLYPHASRLYQKLPLLLLPTYFTTIKNQCQTSNMAHNHQTFQVSEMEGSFF